jgi:SAM-dependent methyltransferase
VGRRLQVLRAGIEPRHEVLEIGPWHEPIAPRALGYRTTILDIKDTRTLRAMAASDPQIRPGDIGAIEDVDIVGSACDVAELVRGTLGPDKRFDWVLSSHNVEHMPNPIRFLRQAAEILHDGGVLRMAIPDKRACFDHFRPLTDISEWLQAHDENRVQPTIYQLFREDSLRSVLQMGGRTLHAWQLGDMEGGRLLPAANSLELYRRWFGAAERPGHYVDTHCWAFTPDSFELLVRDVIAFGLLPMQVDRVSATRGHEFFVDVRRCAVAPRVSEPEYLATRARLLGRCVRDDDAALAARVPLSLRLARRAKRFVRRLARTHLPRTRLAG